MNTAADRSRRIVRRVALVILAVALLSAFLLFDTPPTGNWEGKLVLVPKGSPLPEVVGILREGRGPPASAGVPRAGAAHVFRAGTSLRGVRLPDSPVGLRGMAETGPRGRHQVRGDGAPGGEPLRRRGVARKEKAGHGGGVPRRGRLARRSPATGDPGGERGGVSLPRQLHLREARHAGGDPRVHGAAVPQESSPGCGKAGEGGGPFLAPGRDDRLDHREGDRVGGGEADRVGGHPETPGPRHAAPDGPDGDLRGEAIRRDGDAEGPADGRTVQHLPEPGAAPGADRQPGARGARRRPESVEGRSTFTSCRRTTGPTRSRGRFAEHNRAVEQFRRAVREDEG